MKVLMIGPARSVKGGMTTVVDNYYQYGLDKKVELKYIETINEKNVFSKWVKEKIGMLEFQRCIDKFDVIHIHMASRRSTFRKGMYAKIAKKKNKKVIIHIHGADYKIFYRDECSEKQKKQVRKILSLADHIIVLSEEWKDFFKELVNESKIEVIYNAVNIPNDFEKNVDSNNILFLGRLGHRKGIYDLIDVLKKLVCDYPQLKLYAGGDGEVEKVKRLIHDEGLEEHFQYVGWVNGDEKERLLKECSFYVLPSYNEGMPMSVLEGMAYKNVTISTRVGGIPKVIENEQNGMIIEPGDKEALYMDLKKLLEDRELRKKLSENARKTIEEKFDIIKVINKVIQLYEE